MGQPHSGNSNREIKTRPTQLSPRLEPGCPTLPAFCAGGWGRSGGLSAKNRCNSAGEIPSKAWRTMPSSTKDFSTGFLTLNVTDNLHSALPDRHTFLVQRFQMHSNQPTSLPQGVSVSHYFTIFYKQLICFQYFTVALAARCTKFDQQLHIFQDFTYNSFRWNILARSTVPEKT